MKIIFNQQVFRLPDRQCFTCFIVNQHQFRGIFIDRKVLKLDSQRQLPHFLIFIGSPPFGLSYLCSHMQTLHIGISQYSSGQCKEKSQMVQHKRNVPPMEMMNPPNGGQPQQSDHPEEQQHKRTGGQHLGKSQPGFNTGQRYIGLHLADQSHHYSEHGH